MPLPSIPQINLAKAVAAGAIGNPSAVGFIAEVAAGGIGGAGVAAGLLRPLTTAAAIGTAGVAASTMAAVTIPVAGSTLLIGNAISAADEGRLKEHLVNEGRDFASHVVYATLMGGAAVLLAPTTPFTVGTVLIAASTTKAVTAVTKRLLQCTSAGDCAFKVSNPNSLSGGSSRNSKSKKSISKKSISKSSSTHFFTISIINENSVETKRITLETKKHITREVFKKEIEKILNIFVKPMTQDELK